MDEVGCGGVSPLGDPCLDKVCLACFVVSLKTKRRNQTGLLRQTVSHSFLFTGSLDCYNFLGHDSVFPHSKVKHCFFFLFVFSTSRARQGVPHAEAGAVPPLGQRGAGLSEFFFERDFPFQVSKSDGFDGSDSP